MLNLWSYLLERGYKPKKRYRTTVLLLLLRAKTACQCVINVIQGASEYKTKSCHQNLLRMELMEAM